MRGLRDDRRLALIGVAGPLIFLAGVILVSWAERDFMAVLGWDQWPSGTALGPHGWITVITFLLTGLCQIAFGAALFAQAGRARVRQIGPALLILSGLGMTVLAFKTDPEGGDQTWHGLLHVIGYMTFFFPLLLAYVFLVWASWNRLDRSTWKYAPLALVPWLGALVLPDGLEAGNYLFFAVLFTPLQILALRTFLTGGWPAARRGEVSGHLRTSTETITLTLVVGALDEEEGFRRPEQPRRALSQRSPERTALVEMPMMEHALLLSPVSNRHRRPFTPSQVDAALRDWFRRHLNPDLLNTDGAKVTGGPRARCRWPLRPATSGLLPVTAGPDERGIAEDLRSSALGQTTNHADSKGVEPAGSSNPAASTGGGETRAV